MLPARDATPWVPTFWSPCNPQHPSRALERMRERAFLQIVRCASGFYTATQTYASRFRWRIEKKAVIARCWRLLRSVPKAGNMETDSRFFLTKTLINRIVASRFVEPLDRRPLPTLQDASS